MACCIVSAAWPTCASEETLQVPVGMRAPSVDRIHLRRLAGALFFFCVPRVLHIDTMMMMMMMVYNYMYVGCVGGWVDGCGKQSNQPVRVVQ